MERWKGPASLVAIWAGAAFVAGARTHARGGVFGEAVGLVDAITAQLLYAAPWVVAAAVAWWAAGRWPVGRHDILRPLAVHGWIGLGVVAGQQVLATAVSTLLPIGLRPLDPWGRLPEHLTYRGPVALIVYLVLVASCVVIRKGRGPSQEAPAAGSDESP
jgi:hypothetical protein